MKSYTDFEQSKKLTEILPLESSDMSWVFNGLGKPFARTIPIKGDPEELYACWSLTALLDVLPDNCGISKEDGKYAASYVTPNGWGTYTNDNPVDACVTIIEKLHELNLL